MSSARFGEKQNSQLAVLPTQIEYHQADLVARFYERVSTHERRLIEKWNATQKTWADDPCLHELVEVQAARSPDAPAVICGDTTLSYRDLNERAHRVAARLLQEGIVSQEPIGIIADCSENAIVGILGILKAGGAYLPLDSTLPDERLGYFLEDAGVRFVVGDPLSRTWLANSPVTLLSMRDLPESDQVRLPKVSPDQLAYVLYTSGSTGKAKGVMLNHRGPVNTVRDVNQRFNIRASDRVLALSSLGFDLSVYDLFGMLAVGGTIIQPTLSQSRDPQQWFRLIQEHKISVWNTVPALMDMLLIYAEASTQYPSLHLVMLSGDWIPVSLPDRIRAAAPHAQVVSLGGSTEASIWSALFPIEQVDPEWRSIPYGMAMLNQRLYVVDDDVRLSPIGEVGELCLAGVGVAEGYLNKSELTAERFVSDPWAPGSLMYRTGDLCRYLPDGNLEFLGRRDHQIKIRGYRIGLGEIESEIERLPEVRDAAVIASEEGAGARLIAYVVLNAESELSLEQLNARLGLVLPEYMLPSALVKLTKLPLSANGKVDRRQLPQPSIERSTAEIQLPRTPTECLVSGILCKLLKLPQIDVRDDFYALGGHSLLAVALVCEIRNACGVQLYVPEVLSKSLNTIELARLIDAGAITGRAVEAVPAMAASGVRLTRAPLSYSQQQLWVVNFLEHKRQRYNVPLIYEIEVPSAGDRLNLQALQFAFNELVQRHDILRTVYVARHSKLEQVVLPATDLPLQSHDLRGLPATERPNQFDKLVFDFVTEPFDLHDEMPIRAALVQLDDNQWRLAIAIHHIAIDGLSVNLIQREIAERYQAFISGQNLAKPALPLQYANYAAWQHDHMPPNSFELERKYWREQMSGPLPVLDLPHDKTPNVEPEGETLYVQLERPLFEALTRFSRERQVTPFITLLAAIKAVFYRYTGQEDILIGSPVSTRADQTTQELIGYFINVLPLRTRFDGSQSFADLLTRVRGTVLGALEHRQYPFELLKKELLTSEVAGRDPFQVMFVLEDEPEALQLPGLNCQSKSIDTQTTKFDLLIAAFVSNDRIRFELQYRRAYFHRERIEAFGRHLQAFLSAVVERPEQAISRIDWLPGHEQSKLVGPSVELAPAFLQSFTEQANRTPTATAVVLNSDRLTYAELEQRSSALAGYLQQRGAGCGARIGIHLPRSPEMIVAVLAVLKTGAAYVPIDPAWPAKRRGQVLQDCEPALVLSHSKMCDLLGESKPSLPRVNCDTFDYTAVDWQDFRAVTIEPDSTAYILYTSGSTGRPKGVAMRHAALDNLLAWQKRTSTAGAATKTLQFASLGFDVSFQEILATLNTGGQLWLVEEDLQQDLNRLWKFIVGERIERLFVPFVALRGLCEIAGNKASSAALKEVITAGEQLQITPAVRSFFEQLPECRLWNQYGPTETHVVTANMLEGRAETWLSNPAIGQPIDNCEVVLLDRHLQPVPKGIQGELYLGGQCLANGYYNQVHLTQERFVSHTLTNTTSSGRLYRTGDMGYVNWDGQLQFIGRNDHQIKLRGHRVELSEIELALADCPGVQQAVVSVHSCGAGTQLRAHLLTEQAELDIAGIASQLADALPAYMIPQQFSVVDRFPTTATGKVDRQQLAARDVQQVQPNSCLAASDIDDPVVARLKPIWQSVLQQEHLDADSNFFDYGGDSLAAAILFSLMEAEFGRAISIDTLIKCPTMRTLAEVYRVKDGSQAVPSQLGSWDKLVPLQPHGTRTPIICLAGIDGHFLNFRHMAGLLGDDQPMWGLQAVGLNGTDQPLTEIVDIAADHVKTLQAAIPHGPYNLVGFSFGGIVAFEMAQILRRQGEQVALALIDCSTGMPQRATLLQSLAFHFRYARELSASRRWQYMLERVKGYWLGVKFKLKLISWEERLEGLIDVKGSYAHVAAVNMQALSRYRPANAEGSAVLYRAKLRADWPGKDRTDPAESWSPLFADGQFSVVDIEGAHASLLNRPNVDALVEHLRTLLR